MIDDEIYDYIKKNIDELQKPNLKIHKTVIDMFLAPIITLGQEVSNIKASRQIKLMCNVWDLISEKLIKDGTPIYEKDGLKEYLIKNIPGTIEFLNHKF